MALVAEWREVRAALGLRKVPHYSTWPMRRAGCWPGPKRGTFRRAQAAVVRHARDAGLIDAAPVAAVDTTGLEARHVSAYFRMRRGEARRPGRRRRAWPKLTAVLHTHSHLILAAVTGTTTGPAQDSPDFALAMRQPAALVLLDTALADAGYDTENNHRLCREELGLRRSVIALNPRNTGRRWPKTPYRRAMRRRFPHALYHQRWHVESGSSRHKRRLGSALTARSTAAQARELALRVLTHDLMLLRLRDQGFQQGKRLSKPRTRSSLPRDGRPGPPSTWEARDVRSASTAPAGPCRSGSKSG